MNTFKCTLYILYKKRDSPSFLREMMTSDLACILQLTFKFRFHLQSALALLSSAECGHSHTVAISI